MQGRTRSFFEDVVVLLVIVLVIGAGYYFFFSNNEEQIKPPVIEQKVEITEEKIDSIKEQSLNQEVQEVGESTQTKIVEQNSQKTDELLKEELQKESKKIQDSQDTKEDIKTPKIPQKQIQKEVLKKNDELKVKKVDPKRIAHLVKNVDLKALQQFKNDVKQEMKDRIVLNKEKDKKVQSFSIRVTVLKNGEYEQLIHTGGDKETYENNKENLLQVFPLNIEDNIKQDFPRYLRYTFKFNNNDK